MPSPAAPETIHTMAEAVEDRDGSGAEAGPGAGRRLAGIGLVLAMVVGSVTLWIGSPLFWLWLCSSLLTTQPSMGPYGLMLAGIIATSIVIAKLLAALNRRYAAVMGSSDVNLHIAWLRGLGGEHEKRIRTVSVLDVVMVVSVLIAAIMLAVWFIVVQPTPPGVGPGPSKD